MNAITSDAVAGTAPVLQHETPQGVETGLLLAPHASFRYSGSWKGSVDETATSDYIAYAEAILDPGYGQSFDTVPGAPASITIVVPQRTTTNT
jgi:hypothetical protein